MGLEVKLKHIRFTNVQYFHIVHHPRQDFENVGLQYSQYWAYNIHNFARLETCRWAKIGVSITGVDTTNVYLPFPLEVTLRSVHFLLLLFWWLIPP